MSSEMKIKTTTLPLDSKNAVPTIQESTENNGEWVPHALLMKSENTYSAKSVRSDEAYAPNQPIHGENKDRTTEQKEI